MGEEVRITDYHGGGDDDNDGGGDDDRVLEWETGLPSVNDLAPLSQGLIPVELASAFSITPEPHRSLLDVNRASQNTLSSLRGQSQPSNKFNFKSFNDDKGQDPMVLEADETDLTRDGSDSRKIRRLDSGGAEEADSALRMDNSASGAAGADDSSARTLKRPRLVWTPQLHKRFVDVVAHLGIKNAVPKTIMQLMNVEGLTRENVASHLQKYRLYLKRMQGLSNEGPSASDHLFASTPVPQSLHESSGGGSGNGHTPVPMMHYPQGMVPMPYAPQMMPMPVNHGFEAHPYNMGGQQRDWSGSKYNSVPAYHHRMSSNDK